MNRAAWHCGARPHVQAGVEVSLRAQGPAKTLTAPRRAVFVSRLRDSRPISGYGSDWATITTEKLVTTEA
jgi:hypothetical protein